MVRKVPAICAVEATEKFLEYREKGILYSSEIGIIDNQAVRPIKSLRPFAGQQGDIAGQRTAQGVPGQ